jgi:chromosome segregation ATPase
MIRPFLKAGFAALLIALLGVVACGSDEVPEEDPVVTLTQELEVLRSELGAAQTNLISAQDALRDRFSLGEASLQENLSTVESNLMKAQGDLSSVVQEASTLESALTSTSQELAAAQGQITALERILSDLKDSFLLTRDDVTKNNASGAQNGEAVDTLAQELADLRSIIQSFQEETVQSIIELEAEISVVSAANQVLETRVVLAAGYARAAEAYFSYQSAITTAARNTAFLALEDAVSKARDADLENALNDWTSATTGAQDQFLGIFLEVLSTRLILSLTA